MVFSTGLLGLLLEMMAVQVQQLPVVGVPVGDWDGVLVGGADGGLVGAVKLEVPGSVLWQRSSIAAF